MLIKFKLTYKKEGGVHDCGAVQHGGHEDVVAGAVDEGVLHLCVAGILDVVWGGGDEGAEAQVECDAPFLHSNNL